MLKNDAAAPEPRCHHCGKEVSDLRRENTRGQRLYCSVSCNRKASALRVRNKAILEALQPLVARWRARVRGHLDRGAEAEQGGRRADELLHIICANCIEEHVEELLAEFGEKA